LRMSTDEFRRKYPNLAKEILDGQYEGIRLTVDQGFSDPWHGYLPNVYDYLRRCRDESEAVEVIEYLVRRGEIPLEEGEELKRAVREHGLAYFGERKSPDYYYKAAQRYWKSLRKNR